MFHRRPAPRRSVGQPAGGHRRFRPPLRTRRRVSRTHLSAFYGDLLRPLQRFTKSLLFNNETGFCSWPKVAVVRRGFLPGAGAVSHGPGEFVDVPRCFDGKETPAIVLLDPEPELENGFLLFSLR